MNNLVIYQSHWNYLLIIPKIIYLQYVSKQFFFYLSICQSFDLLKPFFITKIRIQRTLDHKYSIKITPNYCLKFELAQKYEKKNIYTTFQSDFQSRLDGQLKQSYFVQ